MTKILERSFKTDLYSKKVVAPAVSKGLRLADPLHTQLPWGWISLTLQTKQQQLAFSCWWSIRVRDQLPAASSSPCPCCKVVYPSLRQHLTATCVEVAQVAQQKRVPVGSLFEAPQRPTQFLAVLEVIHELTTEQIRPRHDHPSVSAVLTLASIPRGDNPRKSPYSVSSCCAVRSSISSSSSSTTSS